MSQLVRTQTIFELAVLFLKLGTIAFGGPAAHIAMMENEVVRIKKWLSHEEFLDLLGATNLIPGPNSTEMAIHIGYKKAGWLGLIVAGLCFILPASLIVLAVAWSYVQYKTLPQMNGILAGVKPVVIVVIIQALLNLSKTALKNKFLHGLGAVVALANFFGINEIVLLLASGVLVASFNWVRQSNFKLPLAVLAIPFTGSAVGVQTSFGFTSLFVVFLKIGSVLFGSGYVLLAFLKADLVNRLHWLTEQQLLDAVAVGQITPGPVFTTATFIGYLLGGTYGAFVATLGIFLPAFLFVAASAPFIHHLRRSKITSGFLDGVNVASLALMLVVAIQLGFSAIYSLPSVLVAIGAAVLLFYFRINSAWLIFLGALVGVLFKL